MNTNFSIGEVAKLHNVSVQTLRHYDKIGLLKPAYINETSKYRYYSVKHFIVLDFIKQCKAMGLSLEEIKTLVDNYTSIDSIRDIIGKQKEMIEEKIKTLSQIKNNIAYLENGIEDLLKEGINEVFVKHYEERTFIKYNSTKRYTEEFEIQLTQILGEMEKKYGNIHRELAFAISYDNVKKYGKPIYDHAMINVPSKMILDKDKDKQVIIMQSGIYVTINFDDDYKDTSKYYEKLVHYIEEKNIKVSDTFYERYIITRISKDNEEKALGQIQILVENA
ncbi:MAG: MerR family transcriptional regulator [Cellulosilyticaceae bacterium]